LLLTFKHPVLYSKTGPQFLKYCGVSAQYLQTGTPQLWSRKCFPPSHEAESILGKIPQWKGAFFKEVLFHEAECAFWQKFCSGTPQLQSGKYFPLQIPYRNTAGF